MPPRQPDPRRDRRSGGTDPSIDPTVPPLRSGADRGRRGSGGGNGRGGGTGGAGGGGAGGGGGGERSAIGDARRYTPRGRSVREADAERAQRSRGGDPFRPALQVVRGGADEPVRRAGRSGGVAVPGSRRGAGSDDTARKRGDAAGRKGGDAAGRKGGDGAARRGGDGAGRKRADREAPRPSVRGRAATGDRNAARAGERKPTRTGKPAPTGKSTRTGAPARTGKTAQTGLFGRRAPVRRPARKPKRPPRLAEPVRRLRFTTVFVLLLFLVIGGRLVELQLIDAKAYAAKGLERRTMTMMLPAPRGTIYDRDKAVLAHSVEARYVAADPTMVADPEGQARALAPLLGVPASELVPKLARHNFDDGRSVRFEYLARGVDIAVAEQVRALNLPGIRIHRDERRDAPGHDLAANLIGFTGYGLEGRAGLEAGFDDQLRGTRGERTFEIGGGNMAAEIPGGFRVEKPARPGTSLQLTIDRDLQFKVQYLLAQRMQKINPTFASAVVLDVKTGEVLAQASYPPFDAAAPHQTPRANWGDANTGLVVDPGSVAKVITLGGALQEGIVKPDSTVTIGPTIQKGDTVYRDTHPLRDGTRITLPGLLGYSSNVGTIKLADQLGADRLYDYQQRFGLGRSTESGLPGESAGLIQPPKRWSGSSYGSIPIGNGIAVTPLQMTAAYAAIANGGVYIQPRLVKATIAPNGKVTPAAPPRTHRVLSEPNAATMCTMLEAVVAMPGATGRQAAVPGYRIAGKTGTGKRVVDGNYAQGDVASFIGIAPADAPRYVIGVFAHASAGGGGDVAAPAFRDMMAFTLGHYQVPPTGAAAPKFTATA